MTRDYKSARGGRSGGLSGTAGLLLGLAIGLGVALAVFLYDRRPDAREPGEPQAARDAKPASAAESAEEGGKKYDFYEMLPKFEVVVPERDKVQPGGAPAAAVRVPGAYELQAGSYRNFKDADRMRAQLALQGIESRIERVAIDDDTWHRIRIGPISDLNELNRTRQKLQSADIDTILVRVGD